MVAAERRLSRYLARADKRAVRAALAMSRIGVTKKQGVVPVAAKPISFAKAEDKERERKSSWPSLPQICHR